MTTQDELKTLLENAAKACGIVLDFNISGDNVPYYINSRGGHSSWQPHLPGLDSQVLAAELWIDTLWNTNSNAVECSMANPPFTSSEVMVDDYPSKAHAQAMAVLRVAAAIGLAHEEKK